MSQISQQRTEFRRIPRKALFTALLGLCVFIAVLGSVTVSLRAHLRSQILARDAAVLNSLALFEVEKADSLALSYYGLKLADEDSMLDALLDVSRLEGVVAFRVFDTQGELLDAAPSTFIRGKVRDEDLATLRALNPVSRFIPLADPDSYFLNSETDKSQNRLPILEVFVPVHRRNSEQLDGIGQYLLDGTPTAHAFRELDRNLMRQAAWALMTAFIMGGGLMLWAFISLNRGYQLLYARTRELARANRELALRSRVSAIGAVTANLLHGLKNPLAALSMYVEERRRTGAAEEGLEDAKDAASRMARMIEESVAILGQEDGEERFDYTLGEISEVVLGKAQNQARELDVALSCENCPEQSIDNRRGNLLALAAVNLVQNAVQASPAGKEVAMRWECDKTHATLRISDKGPGLPPHMAQDPFKPVTSSKRSGSGVGLAIAAQLVRQMGGQLHMEKSDAEGTTFAIRFETEGN
ncbi:MAG: HAMP domain-containing histidine kinase [Opitutales bacterium]|nr:HAMP domain-containing histidine kinase [Opitutales bacterium]